MPIARCMVYSLRNIIFFLSFFFFVRVGFFITYFQNIEEISFTKILIAFLTGLRFDLSASMMLLALPLSMVWVRVKNKKFYLWIDRSIQTIFSVAFIIAIADVFYYNFAQKRLGFEIFIFLREPIDILLFILKNFWFFSLCFVGIVIFIIKIWNHFFQEYQTNQFTSASLKQRLLGLIVLIILSIISIRGGLQSRPLKPLMAFQNDLLFLGQLALNGVYTVLHAIYRSDDYPIRTNWQREIKQLRRLVSAKGDVFPSEEYPFYRKSRQTKIHFKPKKNLVIIVMESWGFSDIGYSNKNSKKSNTPFFDRIIKKGLFFTEHYSAGQRTIAMLPSIISAIPPIFGNVFTSSSHQYNKHKSLSSILKDLDYQTIFVYASKAGSMGFSPYAVASGFQKVITKDDFDLSKVETDGTWGVFDEYAFSRLYEEIKMTEKPFFAMIKTLHPHLPYKVPSHRKIDFPQRVGFHDDMRYTDQCLQSFFEKVEKENFFRNTLFVITSDHAYEKKKGVDIYHIPLLFYAPGFISARVDDKLTSNLDLLPTILEILRLPVVHSSMGKSLLSHKREDSWALIDLDRLAGWMQNDFLLLSSREESVGLYHYKKDPLLRRNLISEKALRAIRKKLEGNWGRFSSAVGYAIMNNYIFP